MSSKDKIDELVNNNAVVVFSKTYCGYCRSVKDLFKTLNQDVKVLELDVVGDGDDIQNELFKITKQKTVPNVWVGGEFIGGNDATQALHKKGELTPKLEKARAKFASS